MCSGIVGMGQGVVSLGFSGTVEAEERVEEAVEVVLEFRCSEVEVVLCLRRRRARKVRESVGMLARQGSVSCGQACWAGVVGVWCGRAVVAVAETTTAAAAAATFITSKEGNGRLTWKAVPRGRFCQKSVGGS